MYHIDVAGDGNCLFTAIRLAMEINYILHKLSLGQKPSQIIMNGTNNAMIKAGLRVRMKIIEWYRNNLETKIPSFGCYSEKKSDESSSSREWKRGDLLALEMIKKGKDVEESGCQRENAMLKYLLEMSLPGTWGSTPEYTAAAFMTNSEIQVWQIGDDKNLKLMDSVNKIMHQEEKELSDDVIMEQGLLSSKQDILRIQFRRNHYTTLITEEQYETLKTSLGEDFVSHMKIIK